MTPLIIVGGIVFGFFTPTEASVIAVVYSLLLGVFVYRSIALPELPKILYDSARFAAISLFCIGTASAFGWALAYFQIPRALVAEIEAMGLGVIGTGMMIAVAFLIIGMFIDAIPAIIILGTVLWPVATSVGMHPIHFAIIGVISLAFGLVTPPYGLCLLIACAIGKIKVIDALRDVAILLVPMLGVLLLIILLPDLILALPRLLMPKFVN
jgi:tripartite ATP-independent transporter DctM subunit